MYSYKKKPDREKKFHRKLTEEQVRYCRSVHRTFIDRKEQGYGTLGKKFGMSDSAMRAVIDGVTYGWVI